MKKQVVLRHRCWILQARLPIQTTSIRTLLLPRRQYVTWSSIPSITNKQVRDDISHRMQLIRNMVIAPPGLSFPSLSPRRAGDPFSSRVLSLLESEADGEDSPSQELQVRGDTSAWRGVAAAFLGVPARRRLQRVLPHAADGRREAGVHRGGRLSGLSLSWRRTATRCRRRVTTIICSWRQRRAC